MLPYTTPDDGAGNAVVAGVNPAGLKRWVDYIPVAAVADAAPHNHHDDGGHMEIHVLASTAGKVAWVDYIPVAGVTATAGKRGRTDDDGWIAVVAHVGILP